VVELLILIAKTYWSRPARRGGGSK